MVSFTGCRAPAAASRSWVRKTIKRVHFELGGKSAGVVLDDADLDKAVSRSVGACFMGSGQTCSAHTRLLVPKARMKRLRRSPRRPPRRSPSAIRWAAGRALVRWFQRFSASVFSEG